MRLRRLASTVAVAALAVAGIAAQPEPGDVTEDGRLVVGTDPEGDWGGNAAAGSDAAPLAEEAGQDLVAAMVGVNADDPAALDFVIQVSKLPSPGGMPELTRYTWNFTVDGQDTELDGKFTNYSRGACDPTSGACPPPRDPGPAPFTLRGNCTTTENVTTCQELAKLQGSFDAGAGTITVTIPMELIGAAECSVVGPGANTFADTISAAPSAFFSLSTAPMDTLLVTKKFTVPGEACA